MNFILFSQLIYYEWDVFMFAIKENHFNPQTNGNNKSESGQGFLIFAAATTTAGVFFGVIRLHICLLLWIWVDYLAL